MIRMNDFRADPPALQSAQAAAVQRVLSSGWYILGPEVENFEKEFARACGVRHAVGVANGMDAIEIALRARGIGPGDEVITTPMTAFATVLAVIRAGATPRLADIDPASGLMSLESAARCVTSKTRAILLVHLYGHMALMSDWDGFARERNIDLIEDCAQAHLAQWRGQVAGSIGICGAYSFYPTKNLGAAGDAGALVTNSDALADYARSLRNYGQSKRYFHPNLGLNSRLDEIHAAMLEVRLQWLPKFTTRRREIAEAYRKGIRHMDVRPLARAEAPESHAQHLFVVLCDRREALIEHLRTKGVEALCHYPVPVHMQSSCIDIARDSKGLHASEAHAAKCLSLPIHQNLTDDQVACIVEAVNTFE
jgi:dTDP-4-amino-4,6-dideoxygalactose transaminase